MKNSLAQFYTEDRISNLLVSKILVKSPKQILELGVGEGALVRAAMRKWKSSRIIGGDIDQKNVNDLKLTFPELKLFLINGLSSRLNTSLKLKYGSVDVAICNPPYFLLKKNLEVDRMLEASKLGTLANYKVISSDLIFLSQNLRLLRQGGELGIIVPDGLVTSHQFEFFRKKLTENYFLKGVIELPGKIFKKTEARTHILVIKKQQKSDYNVALYKASKEGVILDKLMVNKKDLPIRMDYSYHIWKKSEYRSGLTLEELGVKIFRGSLSKLELKRMEIPFLHTSDLGNESIAHNIDSCFIGNNLNFAKPGDIVLPRVGKCSLEKIVLVENGSILISDCLYVIRASKSIRGKIIDTLRGEYGKKWLKAHSHGVCARVISKRDLLKLKIS